MQIDWVTVSAQIINFLVLVWLLKRFLYKPVIRAMDRRERRIAERLEDAEEKKEEADRRASRYEEKSEELEKQREQLLKDTRDDADEERRKLLAEARAEAEQAREEWLREVGEEKARFRDEVGKQGADAIQAIAARALGDLASRELEDAMASRLVETLQAGETADIATLSGDDEEVQVLSAADLEPGTRSRLTRAIHEHIGKNIEVSYDTAPEVLCGIVLTGGGARFGWCVADYLDALKEAVDEALEKAASQRKKGSGRAQGGDQENGGNEENGEEEG